MTAARSAVVLGASGLVGRALVAQILDDAAIKQLTVFVRRELPLKHAKLKQMVVDFEARATWVAETVSALGERGALFSCLGTTMKIAGSQAAQYRVDHDYQLWGAEAAKKADSFAYVLVSSTGANQGSSGFYLRMKGELERDVLALGLRRVCILRPGFLDGNRSESRPGERLALGVLRHLPSWNSLARVRPVHVEVVARACLAAVDASPGVHIWEAQDVFAHGNA